MNSISFIIYLSGVLQNVSAVMLTVSLVTLSLAAAVTMLWIAVDQELRKPLPKFVVRSTVVGALAMTVFLAIPGERTILLIAASQAIELATKTPAGTNALLLLNAEILNRIKQLQ